MNTLKCMCIHNVSSYDKIITHEMRSIIFFLNITLNVF